ncbi:AAA family ATPase [Sandaracinus amylolyticus]|uniref:AAA family ATPase n=1 Tax=Sandaracinus amylolyticus TaxID=927083 RepID=UPI001F1720FB|nr:AAA family ATPase [Sandaracinus amylolyticus]UJR83657.1 Hypothetical protein I5071_57260 [Sandaracinus amylolyticus]
MDETRDWILETLWSDDELVLSRGVDRTGTHLVVAAASPDVAPAFRARLERALALREHLDPDWCARPRELMRLGERPALLMDDPGGEVLSRYVGRTWDLGDFLAMAAELARAIARLHASGIVHRSLEPATVLVDVAATRAWLTGFGSASRIPQEHASPEPPQVIAGALAYMAPEQTGRVGRSIDPRSDLYSLGVMLYELLAGRLPFTASDPMEWIHCHVAREPAPLAPELAPAPVLEIVHKLLAKTAEDRYQTAGGLARDLRHCLESWRARGDIDPFPLAARDVPDRLSIPGTLYGRQREVAELTATLTRARTRGESELVLVSGYSGVGKSSVVHELHDALVAARGAFASGKFDQYKRDVPYATFAQALRTLVRQILAKSEAEMTRIRGAVRAAVGPNGALVVELVPELELVIGAQPPVPELPAHEAQHRFHRVVRRLLGALAQPDLPIAIFLDDLQWLDGATLALLEHLVLDPCAAHLLLIGAYRDNEVGPSHPLARMLERANAQGGAVREIVLGPLDVDDVAGLIADTLRWNRERAYSLASIVHEKTAGNPFFATQFLRTLEAERLVVFEAERAEWTCDVERVRASPLTENVVVLMVATLERLSEQSRQVLAQLACLGDSAVVDTLALAAGTTPNAIEDAMIEPVRAGLVVRRGSEFAFAHDRVQEAAYASVPEAARPAMHLRLGRLLLAEVPADAIRERVFDVVHHLDRGAVLLTSTDERERVAELDLVAGRRARAAAAYAAARSYLASGDALLPGDAWHRRYDLALAIRTLRAECEILCGNLDAAERLIADLLVHARSNVDRAHAYVLRIELDVLRSQNQRAVESALECLALFGIVIPAHPTEEELERGYARVWTQLDARSIACLVDLPRMTNPDVEAAMQVLAALYAPAVFTDERLAALTFGHLVELSLEHGVTGASTHGFAWFGIMLGHYSGRHADAYELGRLAHALVQRHGFAAYSAKTLFALEILSVWTRPISEALETIRAAFSAGVETGDVTVACYAGNHLVSDRLLRGDPLDAVWNDTERGIEFARRARFGDVVDILVAQQRFIAAMRGHTRSLTTFDGEGFDERAFEAALTPDRMATMVFWYWVIKGQARFLAGDAEEAARALDRARTLRWASPGHVQLLDYHLFSALTLAARGRGGADGGENAWRAEIDEHHEQLARWARSRPETFADKHALVGAEIARLEGRALDAMDLYERAVSLAHENDFGHYEGLACELASSFYASRGLDVAARAHRARARRCYERWGAIAKVQQLDDLQSREAATPTSAAPARIDLPVGQLDFGTVIEITRAVSDELVLETLVERLMTIALEHAGATRGLLVMTRDGTHHVEAEASVENGAVAVRRSRAISAAELPDSVIRYVSRTHESVVVGDAAAPGRMLDDPGLRATGARSVMCVPLVRRGRLTGVLYLENALTPHAFTAARAALLRLLASQAAISLENARLYADLRAAEAYLAEAQRISRTGSFGWDVSRGELVWSDQTYAIFGIDRETQPSLEAMLARAHPSDRERVAARLERAALEGVDWDLEHRLLLPDGTVKHAHVVAQAKRASGERLRFVGAITDITEAKRAEDRLQASIEEKDALLKEVHHRVKNNLQLISSLLSLQSAHTQSPDVAELLADSRNRVRSMALVHENLYRAGNFSKISMPTHIAKLCSHLATVYDVRSRRIALTIDIAPLHLDMDRGMSCGLVVNELVSNALKHAFPDGSSGEVHIELVRDAAGRCALSVADDGVGIPDEIDPLGTDTLGLQLVRDLTEQLGGSLVVERERGTRFVVSFDPREASERNVVR